VDREGKEKGGLGLGRVVLVLFFIAFKRLCGHCAGIVRDFVSLFFLAERNGGRVVVSDIIGEAFWTWTRPWDSALELGDGSWVLRDGQDRTELNPPCRAGLQEMTEAVSTF
jgi:hypothetical protein